MIRFKKQLSALYFPDTNTDYVLFGNDTSLNNLTQLTIVFLAYQDVATPPDNLRLLFFKDIHVQMWIRDNTRLLGLWRNGSTQSMKRESVANWSPVNEGGWFWAAGVFDNPAGEIYASRFGQPFQKPPSYDVSQNLTGGMTDDSSAEVEIGNAHIYSTYGIVGRIAIFKMFNRVLELPELWKIQQNPFADPPGAVISSFIGNTGTILDRSPYGNHGTVTGTTLNAGPALYLPRRSMIVPGTLAVEEPVEDTRRIETPYYVRRQIPLGIYDI